MAAGSYYSRRSANTAGLSISRGGQNRAVRETSCAGREPEAASGLTFHELWLRVGGDRGSLWTILRNEVRSGRIDYHSTTRRYRLNGGLPGDVKLALLRIGFVDDRR